MIPTSPSPTMQHFLHRHLHLHVLFLLLLTTTTTTSVTVPYNSSKAPATASLLPKRRSLHQPLFPVPTTPLLPKYPFSTDPPPFFPFHPSSSSSSSSPPTPPSHQVSEPILPSSIPSSPPPPPPPKPTTHTKLLLAIAIPLSSLLLLLLLLSLFLLHRRRPHPDPENQRILSAPPDHSTTTTTTTTTATHFLHLGSTYPNPAESSPGAVGSPYQKLSSPDLHPLPPLQRFGGSHRETGGGRAVYDSDEEYYYSPDGSRSSSSLLGKQGSSSRRLFGASILDKCRSLGSNRCSRSCPSSDSLCSSPVRSPLASSSPGGLTGKSLSSGSDKVELHPPPPPPLRASTSGSEKRIGASAGPTATPPPPPPPPVGYWEQKIQSEKANSGMKGGAVPVFPVERSGEDIARPKLKPLHWDKVRASSDRAMVWDQLKSSSFRLNEEMIETLFVCNVASTGMKEKAGWQFPRSPVQEERVLNPKKSQNIAILLRALNVTKEEVSEALLEGSMDNMSTELLETLLKMAPSREEEIKLLKHKEDSPCKLGPAEKFLKAVIDVPFAFKRVEAMLYIANFDSEISYLANSFGTLERACEELRSSRMFLKLLEAVLKTGNRMNVGTNRGDACAFKLDTLLKLVDVKGTDGKTTLLHFVVQEITKAEGSRLASANLSLPHIPDEHELKRIGLQVVYGLSGELSNVKKAAVMDSDALSSNVEKLTLGIEKINEVTRLNGSFDSQKSCKFHEAMCSFSKRAEDQVMKIQAQERVSLSLVKEITEYFHGDSAKEEAHPFRIFMVVRDFLSILDRVCKEVREMNKRANAGSGARNFPVPVNPTLPPLFPRLQERAMGSSSEDDDSSSSY